MVSGTSVFGMGSKKQAVLDDDTSEESSERPIEVRMSRQLSGLSAPLSKDEFNKLEFELSEARSWLNCLCLNYCF